MARKHGLNQEQDTFYLDLSSDTNTVTRSLSVLTRDWTKILAASFTVQVVGVGVQNITFQLKVGATNVAPVSGNVANATKDATASVGAGEVTPVLAEGARLDVTATFSGAVTSGAKVAINITFQR